MYNTEYEEKEYKFLAAGKHTDVKLVRIAKENSKKDGSGSEVLRFHFEKNGYLFTHTEWPIKEGAKPEAFQYLSGRIKHILGAFVPKEKTVFRITETNPDRAWNQFCDKVIEIAGKAYEGKLFRLKIVLNNSDFTTFPGFPVFMQDMKEPDGIKFGPKDRIVAHTPDVDNTPKEQEMSWATPAMATEEAPY